MRPINRDNRILFIFVAVTLAAILLLYAVVFGLAFLMNVTVTFKPDKKSMSKQIPFALALALTTTAKEAQAASIDKIQNTFTLRNSWFEPSNRFGIKITPAKKDNLEASVGTDADWLIPHELTGVKVPRGRAIALPVIGGSRTSFQAKVIRRLLPKNIGDKAFVLNTKAGRILYYRKGRGRRRSLQALYFLDPKVKVKVRSVLFDPVEKTVRARFDENFNKALAKALGTAR